jgi:hypothetical protein
MPTSGLAMLLLLASTASCTTFVEPTTCVRGATACGGIHDARFCDYVAISVEGADCAALGIAPARPFSVAAGACGETRYVVRDHDCTVLRQRAVRDGVRSDVPSATPMFVAR